MTSNMFICTGKGSTDRGVLVKKAFEGNETETTIEVIEELGNGSGWKSEVNKSDLVEISYEHYNLILQCNLDFTVNSEIIMNNTINELLKGKE